MKSKILLDALTITARLLQELRHTRRMLLFWVLFPVLLLLLFGLMYAGSQGQARSFDSTVPGILIGAALFFSCLSGPVVTLVGERERGTLRRLLLMPLSSLSYFLGVLLFYLLVALLQTLVVYGVALLFGGRCHGPWPLAALLIVLSVVNYCGIGFVLGASLASRTEDVTGPISAIGVPLLVLGGTFFSPSLMPPFLRALANVNPIYHMIGALRRVSAGGAGWSVVWPSVAALSGMAVLTLGAGVIAYQRSLQKERRGEPC